MNLIIVESPAKGRTIEYYLGENYKVAASFGHVRDLPTKELGVDTDKNFQPDYVIPFKAKKTIANLKAQIKEAKTVYLATDFDREGEAISWHIVQATGLENSKSKASNSKYKRITFTEITKSALEEAVKNPREIDMDLVNAQQARRILDRLVGYKLSPFLWKKVATGLSAGRVQSVAVRLIVEREREIKDFKPEVYFSIEALLDKNGEFSSQLAKIDNRILEKLELKDEAAVKKMVAEIKKQTFIIEDIKNETIEKYPMPPFTTSTLQQTANWKLRFSSKKTMKLAQDLYEAGKITYMRTDSTNLAWPAINAIRKHIEEKIGKNYLPEKPLGYKTKTKGAQEAHEAIRPTHAENDKIQITNDKLTDDHLKLYQLIWSRAVACQMKPALLDTAQLEIQAGKYGFHSYGQNVKFDGYTKIYPMNFQEIKLPELKKGDKPKIVKIDSQSRQTEPPQRYSEATLVKKLEAEGIGRPSTYAPIISTIQDRGYVFLQNRFFYPQEVGEIVTDVLVENFPDVVDISFTAKVEEDFDNIAEGKLEWTKMLEEFYQPFAKQLAEKTKTVEKTGDYGEKSGEKCPKCGKELITRVGKFGKFLACPGFPKCKFTKNLVQESDIECPKCKKGKVVVRRTRKGKVFWGCNSYPKCDYISWTGPK